MNIKKLATKNMSQSRIADYKPFTMVDGEGWRSSLYVSGCVFNCKGCYNKSIQDFGNGIVYDNIIEDKIIEDLRHEKVQGLTLLGGEPMLNTEVCLSICNRVREEFGDTKDIWCWTGYTWEELQESISCNTVNSKRQLELLKMIDILIDGRFEQDKIDTTGKLRFRGSSNQKVVDVKQSLLYNSKVEANENYEE